MININELPTFDMADQLKTPEDIATYLQLALDDEDPGELAHALGIIARARCLTEITQKAVLAAKRSIKS